MSVLGGLLLLLGATAAGPAAELQGTVAAAEAALRQDEPQLADSRHRDVLYESWMILGSLAAAEGRMDAARDAFAKAEASVVDAQAARRALALVYLRLDEPRRAVDLLVRAVAERPGDADARRLLVRSRIASGQAAEAVQDLEEAGVASDPEMTYLLATGYLRLKQVASAERLFQRLIADRPLPQTRVLVGRAWRDAGEYDRSRRELRAALAADPRVAHAHYYLGMVTLLDLGAAGLDAAIAEFRRELEVAPGDPVARLRLGMALVEAQRPAEALPLLEAAAARPAPGSDALLYLGRCLVALQRPAAAVKALERALEAVAAGAAGHVQYQLGLALRGSGRTAEAAEHFAAAEKASAAHTATLQERLTRYLAGEAEAGAGDTAELGSASPVAALPSEERQALAREATTAIARANLNLGLLHLQAQRFARAAERLEQAAQADPAFPKVQYALGVARFNAGAYAAALEPLGRALEAEPQNGDARRLLALASLDAERYERAAELLAGDPGLASDAQLQYAYGLALVRSGRASEAESLFKRLLSAHRDSAEINVVLGQAHAEQGDFPSAAAALRRALELRADVADAHGALGVIELKQGRLAEAEAELRAELEHHPEDVRSRQNLATVLELGGRSEEAVPELRAVLARRPDSADARYLLGKILLGQGRAAEAVEQLEAAARLEPDAPRVQYQLGQAYQKLGRADDAAARFEAFRRLKDAQRGAKS